MTVPVIFWQPIKTAPVDGSIILLFPSDYHGGIAAGYRRTWIGEHWRQTAPKTKRLVAMKEQSEWCYAENGRKTPYEIWGCPTHWAIYVDLQP